MHQHTLTMHDVNVYPQTRTFAEKDGSFTLRDVGPGSHIISAYNKRFVFPEVRRPAAAAVAAATLSLAV